MGNKPLISIITVCYNSEKTIRDTIESVLNQTYKNIEYIIVDGESKDGTVEIIKSYEGKFKLKKIDYKFIYEKDKGIYDAINKGLKFASGEIIGIINSDDWYAEGIVVNIVNNFNKNKEIDILHGNIVKVSAEKKILGIMYPKKLLRLKEGMYINHPSCFVKKEYYEKYGGYDDKYKLASDYKFVLEAYLKHKANFFYLNEIFSYMREEGTTNYNLKLSWKEVHDIRKEIGINRFLSRYYLSLNFIKRFILNIIWRVGLKKKYKSI